MDLHRGAEGPGKDGRREHLGDRPRRQRASAAEHKDMGDLGDDLLDMVRDENQRGAALLGGEAPESLQEIMLASTAA